MKKPSVQRKPTSSWHKWPVDSITVVVPLPHAHLSPNARKHWGARSGKIKKSRENACLCAKEALGRHTPPGWEYATLEVRWYSKRRCPDPDNAIAMLKSSIDGLADAGIFVNDSRLRIESVQVVRLDPESVELCVTRVE